MTAIDQHAANQDADDGVLLERLRAGEDAAFGELFARHSAAVRRLAFSLVNDRSEVDDLTAEAFFRVLQAIRRGSGPVDNVRAYVLLVARRVAWEWQVRRRDVPVSDEELTHRAGAGPDASGASTERNLITRAFTSLPERWRSVLWKVEVEGERPAAVGPKFGLSANATAALARRARQGLRAAYLQAHLTVDRGATGCRSVLEKLGAYTAGCVKGAERRRIRAHLSGCASCASMHDELRDVCSGLRANAALVAFPLSAVVGSGLAGATSSAGLAVTVKGMLASAKVKLAVAASSIAAASVLGIVAAPWGGTEDVAEALDDLDGRREVELVITNAQPSWADTFAVPTGAMTTAISQTRPPATGRPTLIRRDAGGQVASQTPTSPAPETSAPGALPMTDQPPPDDTATVVYQETTVQLFVQQSMDYTVVSETTSVTEVDSAKQTTTYVDTTTYTYPDVPVMLILTTPETTSPATTTTASGPTTSTVPTATSTRALSSSAGKPSPW